MTESSVSGGMQSENNIRVVLDQFSLKRHIRPYRRLLAGSAVALFLLAGAVHAGAEEERFPDRFTLRLGGYNVNNADSIVRKDDNRFPIGTYIDFKDTLGGETSTTVLRLDGLYRFNEHHALGFSWYDIRFTGSRNLNTDIQWGDQTFVSGALIESKLEYDVYKFNYQYSLFHNDIVELGASFGFQVLRISMNLSADNIGQTSGASVTAPLPIFGLFADYNFTPRFSAYYNSQLFFINYQNYSGSIHDVLFGLEYRVLRNVALGAAYNGFSMNLDSKNNETSLHYNTNWKGVMLYSAVFF